MSPLTPSKLSLLCFYFSALYHSHFTTGESLSVFMCGWQVQSRYQEEGIKQLRRGQAVLPPAHSTCSVPNPSPPPHCLPCIPPCLQSFAQTSEACMSACLQGCLSASSLALISCLACIPLGRSCHVSLATFSHGPCLFCPVPETSLDFPKHDSYLCGPCVKRAQQTLVAWLIGFPARPSVVSWPQSGCSFECLPLPPTLRRQWPDSRQQLLPLWAVVLVSRFLGLSSLWEACPAPAWLELDGGNKGFPSLQWGWVCSLEWLELATHDSGFPSRASSHCLQLCGGSAWLRSPRQDWSQALAVLGRAWVTRWG